MSVVLDDDSVAKVKRIEKKLKTAKARVGVTKVRGLEADLVAIGKTKAKLTRQIEASKKRVALMRAQLEALKSAHDEFESIMKEADVEVKVLKDVTMEMKKTMKEADRIESSLDELI